MKKNPLLPVKTVLISSNNSLRSKHWFFLQVFIDIYNTDNVFWSMMFLALGGLNFVSNLFMVRYGKYMIRPIEHFYLNMYFIRMAWLLKKILVNDMQTCKIFHSYFRHY